MYNQLYNELTSIKRQLNKDKDKDAHTDDKHGSVPASASASASASVSVTDSAHTHVVFQPLSPIIAANLLRALASVAEHPSSRTVHSKLLDSADVRVLLTEFAQLPTIDANTPTTSTEGVSALVKSGAELALSKIAWRP